jgi:flagellin
MPLIINTNISALNAQRQLVKSGDEMSQAMERLSSGKRINTAADDAAGMAISSRMTSSIRGLNQAVRNANDGISLIQTAGGALEESTNILQRMRELSIQSANGIYTDANRVSLNAEVEQLKQELTRIATTTSFNGLKILDGTLGDIDLQIGTEAYETITLKVGSGFDAESLGSQNTGISTGTFTLAQTTSQATANNGSSGTLEGLRSGDLEINGVSIPPAKSSDDTESTSDNTASAISIASAINSVASETGVVAEANATTVVFDIAVTPGGNTDAGDLVINGISIDGFTSVDQDTDGGLLVDVINAKASQTGVVASYDATADQLTLTAADGRNIQVDIDSTATEAATTLGATAGTDNTYTGTVTLRSNEAIEIAGNSPADFGFTAGAVEANTVQSLQDTSATAPSAVVTFTASTANVLTHNFSINGVDISFDTTTATNSAELVSNASKMATEINKVSDQTGVYAKYTAGDASFTLLSGNGGTINLVALDEGANADTVTVTSISNSLADETDLFDGGKSLSIVTLDDGNTFENLSNGDLTINGYTVDFSGSGITADNERSTIDGAASAQAIALAINNTAGLSDQVTATAKTVMNLGEVFAGTADDGFTLIVNGLVVDIDNQISSGDSGSNFVAALNSAFNLASTRYASDPTNNVADSDAAGLLASVNEVGELLISAEDGRNITVSVGGQANGASLLANFDITAANSVTSKGTISLEAKEGFSVDEIAGDKRTLAGIENPTQTVADIDISTQDGAQVAIAILDRGLDQINQARGDLGAANNRLDFTVSNLMNVAENTNTARSRIMDADFAAETSMLSRAQVLQQASQAMLAQANALPQQVLRLLQ